MTINNAPDPCEGPYCQQGILIREEAERQLAILEDLAISEPNLGTGGHSLKEVEDGIRMAVAFNWARCLPDWSGMVHLNPAVSDPETGKASFEPWSADLFKIRLSFETGIRVLAAAQAGYGGRKKKTVVAITGTDEGKVH